MQNTIPSRFSQLLGQNNLEQIESNFICPICLDLLQEPYFESENKHSFCKQCIKSLNLCPICRVPIKELQINAEIENQMSKIQIHCIFPGCPWQGDYQDYMEHQKICDIKNSFIQNEISIISNQMRQILEQEINPHLRDEHQDIFNQHCKQWTFLETDECAWQQWWYCDNPWWNNTPCPQCNILYQNRLKELNILDSQRRKLIKQQCGVYN